MLSGDALPAVVFDLSHRTRLGFTGADRLRYLNGQLTQDLKKLSPERALPACVTTAKGRMQADVWVSVLGETIVVDAVAELQEVLAGRLERYIVADDVVLEDLTGKSGLLHCVGVSPAEHPVLKDFMCTRSTRLGMEGWDVLVPLERLADVKLALGGLLADAKDWEVARVALGVPTWGAELGEDTLPPEAGLERTHIDYHKGCYIGQEVISRLKSVGHVNRTLCRFRGEGSVAPQAGNSFFKEKAGSPQAAGTLTSVVADAECFFALGYLKRGHESEKFVTEQGIELTRIL